MVPLNVQPAEKQLVREDGFLDVHSVFKTIQGEGPFAGLPAVFVRLAACNLMCPSCDTEYTAGREVWGLQELAARVRRLLDGTRLVVITGGEPFRQGLGPFVRALLYDGNIVQVETNGTLYDPTLEGTYADFTVVCSPKTPKINPDLIPVIDAYKYVLSADAVNPDDGLPTSVLGMPAPPARPHPGFVGDVFLQPQDDQDSVKNAANVKAVVDSSMRFGYRLSLQMHKIVDLP